MEYLDQIVESPLQKFVKSRPSLANIVSCSIKAHLFGIKLQEKEIKNIANFHYLSNGINYAINLADLQYDFIALQTSSEFKEVLIRSVGYFENNGERYHADENTSSKIAGYLKQEYNVIDVTNVDFFAIVDNMEKEGEQKA